jgi:hypothetical protein
LEAVLNDIKQREIKHIVNLGDCFYGPLDPGGTAQILVGLDIPTVRGIFMYLCFYLSLYL